ncbi:hypothetical protein CDD81_2668 [Ophiocordyceps australis]|uniref:Uncharacterized protein n=1 Tax=Ophiocordyceps australis TaxID=1399860 RepID=A0A2C5XW92_9HYPO|nr:hypothetical protein CDD81_2668 [Ophiocordyceps australis]
MLPLVVATLFLAAAANGHALPSELDGSHVSLPVLGRRQGDISALHSSQEQETQRYRATVEKLLNHSADATKCYYALNVIQETDANSGETAQDYDFGKEFSQCNQKYASSQSLLREAQSLARQASIRKNALSDTTLPQVQSNPQDKETALRNLAQVSAQANSVLSSKIEFDQISPEKPKTSSPFNEKSAKEGDQTAKQILDELHKIEQDLVHEVKGVLSPHIVKLMTDLDKFVMLKRAKNGASEKSAVEAGNQAVTKSLEHLQAKADQIVEEALKSK